MIYYPSYVTPKNTAIDATQDNEFSFVFRGDKLTEYVVNIRDLITGDLVYGDGQTCEAYNGDVITYTVPSGSMSNGSNYAWRLTLIQDVANMFVANGTMPDNVASGETTFKIGAHTMDLMGRELQINGESRNIVLYDPSYPINTGTVTAVTDQRHITIATGLEITFQSNYTLTVNGETRYIIEYNKDTGSAEVDFDFETDISTGDAYVVADPAYGEVTILSPFSEAISKRTQYTIYSAIVATPEAYIQARSAPSVTITPFTEGGQVHRRVINVSGTYFQAQNVGLKKHRWNLYAGDDDKLVRTSGDIYSSDLRWTINGLRPDDNYKLELVCETNSGITVASSRVAFRVAYSPAPGFDAPPTVAYEAATHSVNVSFYDLITSSFDNITGYEVYRRDTSANVDSLVAVVGAHVYEVNDYLVANGKEYQWYVAPVETDSQKDVYGLISPLSDPLVIHDSCWSLTALVPSGESTYDPTQTWRMSLNVTPSQITHHRAVTSSTGYARYPKVVIGDNNYLSGSVSALAGYITANGNYVDGALLRERWRNFVSSYTKFLLHTANGDMMIVSISDNTEEGFAPSSKEMPTMISFSYTEIESCDDKSICVSGKPVSYSLAVFDNGGGVGVKRNGVDVQPGAAAIRARDVLVITAPVDANYYLRSLVVNGVNINSGSAITVTGDVRIQCDSYRPQYRIVVDAPQCDVSEHPSEVYRGASLHVVCAPAEPVSGLDCNVTIGSQLAPEATTVDLINNWFAIDIPSVVGDVNITVSTAWEEPIQRSDDE